MRTGDRISAMSNPSPEDLRAAAVNEGITWLPLFRSAAPMLADAVEIADESSEALIASSCITADSKLPERWYDTWAIAEEDKKPIRQAVRYLELRRRLKRDEKQPHLVRLMEQST